MHLSELKEKYCETTEKIIEVLPVLLSMVDFQKTGNYELVAQRMKEGYYGTVNDGAFIAPTFGPYAGFMKDIKKEDMKQFRELLNFES